MTDPARFQAHLTRRLPEALDLLRQMVGINSWTYNRDGVNRLGQLTAEAFAALGFRAEFIPSTRPAWGNHLVLTREGAGNRRISMVSHLDTVFPPEEEERNNFRWQPEGDRIYGPGTHDIKGGTAMIWMVMDALAATAPEVLDGVTWQVLLNSSEEVLSVDFGALCLTRFTPGHEAALVFEAEGQRVGGRNLVVARKGRASWRIRTAGRGAHAGGRHAHGANAVVQMARVVDRVAALTDYAHHLTVNVGQIHGGTGHNRVPHEAIAEGEMRAFDPAVLAEARARLLAMGGTGDVAAGTDGFPCSIHAEILDESPPWPRNEGTERLLSLYQRAAEDVGLSVEAEERGGLSDGNYIWHAAPTLDGLGPGGDHDHCSERSADGSKVPEYVDVTTFVPKALINLRACEHLVRHGLPAAP